MGRPNHRHRGAAIVEFSIVAALLIFLLFGIMEVGFMFSNALTVSMAAHQGARAAALGQSSAAVSTAVNNAASTLRHSSDPAYLQVAVATRRTSDGSWAAWTPGTAPPGATQAQIRVTVTYKYDYITGGIMGGVGALLGGSGETGGSRTLSTAAVMRYGG